MFFVRPARAISFPDNCHRDSVYFTLRRRVSRGLLEVIRARKRENRGEARLLAGLLLCFHRARESLLPRSLAFPHKSVSATSTLSTCCPGQERPTSRSISTTACPIPRKGLRMCVPGESLSLSLARYGPHHHISLRYYNACHAQQYFSLSSAPTHCFLFHFNLPPHIHRPLR